MKRGKIFFFSGPSGVGKGTLIEHLRKNHPEFKFPPSCTTREMRPGEKEGETYFFITRDEFLKRVKAGEFLEYAEVHGGNLYGTLRKPLLDPIALGLIVIREFDVQGFDSARKLLPREDYVSIFLAPKGGIDELIHRIQKRGAMPAEELKHRLESMKREFEHEHLYDHKIIVEDGNIEKMVADGEKIIADEL